MFGSLSKIYNINSVTGQDLKNDNFQKLADHICKSIFFEIEQKMGIEIRFINPKIDKNEGKILSLIKMTDDIDNQTKGIITNKVLYITSKNGRLNAIKID